MSTLHLRNVPDDVDRALRAAAEVDGTSLNRQAITAIRRGLGLDQFDRASTIRQIRQDRASVPELDAAELIRSERPGA